MNTSDDKTVFGVIDSFEIGVHESYLGFNPTPDVEMKLTVVTSFGDTIELVAWNSEWQKLINALIEGLADMEAREEEEEREEEERLAAACEGDEDESENVGDEPSTLIE